MRTETLFKTYKPITPGIRHLKRPLNPHIWEGRPVRLLTFARRKRGGRNSQGVITVRHRGGGHRQRIRIVDFHRKEPGVHDVVRIEYDPGRSAHIALVCNRNPNAEGMKKWSYILATEGMRAGDQVQSFRQGIPRGFIPGFDDAFKEGKGDSSGSSSQTLALGLLRTLTLKPGNVLPLRLIPPGTIIHNISLKMDGPGILVRSAGSYGQIIAHEEGGRYVQVQLQSGEVRKVLKNCCATIGKVSNSLWKNRILGKAGRARWLGRRPSVRGVAMNAYVVIGFFALLNPHSVAFAVVIILMVVDVEDPNPTNIQCQYGVGELRVRVLGSQVPKVLRTAIKWSFVNAREVLRRGVEQLHRIQLFLCWYINLIAHQILMPDCKPKHDNLHATFKYYCSSSPSSSSASSSSDLCFVGSIFDSALPTASFHSVKSFPICSFVFIIDS